MYCAQAGKLGLETNRPLPRCCNSPRLHRTHQGLYQRPRVFFQVRAAGPLCQVFPCSSYSSLNSFLCRASIQSRLDLVIRLRRFVSQILALLQCILVVTVLL